MISDNKNTSNQYKSHESPAIYPSTYVYNHQLTDFQYPGYFSTF